MIESMKHAFTASLVLNGVLVYCVLILANRLGYLGRLMVASGLDVAGLPTDTLASRPEWQEEVKTQVALAQNQRYEVCLLGDSISSGLSNSLGSNTFNFAIAGMSSVSQLEQLKQLIQARVKCDTTLIAVGTNDAAYRSNDEQFVKNMKTMIALLRTQMGTQSVAVLPAFYSTTAASHDPSLAGPLNRVNRINTLLKAIAAQEKEVWMNQGLQDLYNGQVLKQNLTLDGVHLNPQGEEIYRRALLGIMASLKTIPVEKR